MEKIQIILILTHSKKEKKYCKFKNSLYSVYNVVILTCYERVIIRLHILQNLNILQSKF